MYKTLVMIALFFIQNLIYAKEYTIDGLNGDFSTIGQAINELHGESATLVISNYLNVGSQEIPDNYIPRNINLQFSSGGGLSFRSGEQLKIDGRIEAGMYKVFDFSYRNPSGQLLQVPVYGNPKIEYVLPSWFPLNSYPSLDDNEVYEDWSDAIRAALNFEGTPVFLASRSEPYRMLHEIPLEVGDRIYSNGATVTAFSKIQKIGSGIIGIYDQNSNISKDIQLHGIKFELQEGLWSDTKSSLVIKNSSYVSISNCQFIGGHRPSNEHGALTIINSEFISIKDSSTDNTAGNGILFMGTADSQVLGGTFSNAKNNGSGIAFNGDKNFRNIVSNVHAFSNEGTNISFNTQDSTLSNCISSGSIKQSGIAVGHDGSPASGSRVVGCLSEKNYHNGIALNQHTENVLIANNTFVKNGVVGSGTERNRAGIRVIGDNHIIQNNIIRENDYGVVITDLNTKNILVQGNSLRGNIIGRIIVDSHDSVRPNIDIRNNL